MRLLSIIALCICPTVNAGAEDLSFRRFTVEDGLSQGTVSTLLQDHWGYIWIGTQDGLNRFDGISFRIFRHDPADSTSLDGNWITALYEDLEGNLWVGTTNGLNRFDPMTGYFHRYNTDRVPSSARSTPVGCITGALIDRQVVTIAILDGLYAADPASSLLRWLPIHAEGQIPLAQTGISTVISGPCDLLWLARGSHITAVNPGTGAVEKSFQIGMNAVALARSAKREDEIIVGGESGAFRLHCGTGLTTPLLNEPVTAILEDHRGNLWGATKGGLARVSFSGDAPGVTEFHHDPMNPASLSDNGIRTIIEDANGNLWIGTFGGLNYLDHFAPSFLTYNKIPGQSNSLGHSFVLSIMEDQTGGIWFGTFGGGISILRRTSFTHMENGTGTPDILCGNNVRSLLQDRTGGIWVGTGSGLTYIEPSQRRTTCYDRIPPADTITFWVDAMCQTTGGTIWVGANGMGLVRIDPGGQANKSVFTVFPLLAPHDGKPAKEVHCITEDREAMLWVGTEIGLVRFNPFTGECVRHRHDPENAGTLSANPVWAIQEDLLDSNALWVGTSQGLNRVDKRSGIAQRYLKQQGFPNDFVYAILTDSRGRVWCSTNHGLTCFDDSLPEGQKFRNYDITDGVQGNEFNRNSFHRLRNGEFLFGGTRGVTRFNPLYLRRNPQPPGVVLRLLTVDGTTAAMVASSEEAPLVELAYDKSAVTFEYIALSYTNPARNQYSYMLEGLDNTWTSAETRRYAAYAHLEPGEYLFRVRASNSDGVWNEQGASIRFLVHPPYWRTWWFMSFVAAAVVASGFMAVRLREKRSLEVERMRARMARDLHDDIGSSLSSIAIATAMLRDHSPLDESTRAKLSGISSVALDTLGDLRDMVWLVNPGNDALGHLLLRMKDTASRILEEHRRTMTFPQTVPDRRVNLEWKRQVFLVYKEALTNILRHAQATEVMITIEIRGEQFTMMVTDNGIGFDPGSISHGNGLKNMRARAGLIGATLEVESASGRGTRLSLSTRIT